MTDGDRSPDSHEIRLTQFTHRQRQILRRQVEEQHHRVTSRYSYQKKMGRETVHLDPIEFRILRFLASRPYRAFTRRRIAEAVSTQRHPVAEENLDRHIASLRHALGFFRDYIQTVPYIGYRFKE